MGIVRQGERLPDPVSVDRRGARPDHDRDAGGGVDLNSDPTPKHLDQLLLHVRAKRHTACNE